MLANTNIFRTDAITSKFVKAWSRFFRFLVYTQTFCPYQHFVHINILSTSIFFPHQHFARSTFCQHQHFDHIDVLSTLCPRPHQHYVHINVKSTFCLRPHQHFAETPSSVHILPTPTQTLWRKCGWNVGKMLTKWKFCPRPHPLFAQPRQVNQHRKFSLMTWKWSRTGAWYYMTGCMFMLTG